MKLRLLIVFLFVFGIVTPVMAAPEDMEVSTWDTSNCEHTMTTNHFELAPGQSVEIILDLTGCGEPHEGMLFFGYNTTKNSSRQLTARDKIRLTIVGTNPLVDLERTTEQEWEWNSDVGYVYVPSSNPSYFVIYAENMNQKKTLKIRLRGNAIY